MRIIALGFFDGVHRGHGALLRRAKALAQDKSVSAACLTFDRHPGVMVGKPVSQINTVAEREWLMRTQYGMDEVLVLPFDEQLMHTPWEDFAARLLGEMEAVGLVCGEDFRFGDRAQGTAERLRDYAAARGVVCEIVSPVLEGEAPVSSTRIRAALESGDIHAANELLGHPHLITGVVEHGKQMGRQLGFPTANLAIAPELLVPRKGVYAARVTLPDGSKRIGVTNIGLRPTVEDSNRANVEPWLLDFSGDLYGQSIRVELLEFLRPETKFDSVEALRAQVMADGDRARELLEGRL